MIRSISLVPMSFVGAYLAEMIQLEGLVPLGVQEAIVVNLSVL